MYLQSTLPINQPTQEGWLEVPFRYFQKLVSEIHLKLIESLGNNSHSSVAGTNVLPCANVVDNSGAKSSRGKAFYSVQRIIWILILIRKGVSRDKGRWVGKWTYNNDGWWHCDVLSIQRLGGVGDCQLDSSKNDMAKYQEQQLPFCGNDEFITGWESREWWLER